MNLYCTRSIFYMCSVISFNSLVKLIKRKKIYLLQFCFITVPRILIVYISSLTYVIPFPRIILSSWLRYLVSGSYRGLCLNWRISRNLETHTVGRTNDSSPPRGHVIQDMQADNGRGFFYLSAFFYLAANMDLD